MDPLIGKALDALSIVCNLSTGLAHPLDESRAKELFVALHARGIPLPRDDIQTHAEACGWTNRHAKQLAELAARIDAGSTVRISHSRGWGEAALARLVVT